MNKTQMIRNWLTYKNPNIENAVLADTFKRNEKQQLYNEFEDWKFINQNIYSDKNIGFEDFKAILSGIVNTNTIKTYKKKVNKIKRKCNCCHKEFITEVDEKGIAYNTRCRSCKIAEKQYKIPTYRTIR